MNRVFSLPENGTMIYRGTADFYARFIQEKQLKDRALWQKFVHVFSTREDDADNGWRGEYFGKMMRGACLTYRYTQDETLYAVLDETVRALLCAQDKAGRITTYSVDKEFQGWDMWVRKYVLVGCLYFYDICKDEALKADILTALKHHADYIIERIGEGKRSILDTSEWWGAINSSSILEPIVELYKHTREARYLNFAKYLVESGGCKDGNLITAVEEGKLLPHEFPTTKAYEMMSYFEGILAYYEVTGEKKYLELCEKFADLVNDNEVTVIGCAGCKSEQFNHSVIAETEPVRDKTIMQETCVTVTWMRLQQRLLLDTGAAKYADRMERSALNALYGAVNLYGIRQFCKEEKTLLDGVPFDSYSPLVCQPRGIGIGGYKKFSDGGYYGCCACIGAAGTALYPLSSVLKSANGYAFNFYESGEVRLGEGNATIAYDAIKGEVAIKFSKMQKAPLFIRFRIPKWAEGPTCELNGENRSAESGEYLDIERVWQTGDEVKLSFHPALRSVKRNGKTSVYFGAYVLCRDEQKENEDIKKPIKISRKEVDYVFDEPQEGEAIRLRVMTKRGDILFTDYASCGKHWDKPNARISVWFKVKRSIFG